MDDANDVRHGRRISLHRARFLFLLVILSCLVAGDVILSLFPSLRTRHPPSLITRDWLYEYIEGAPLAVDPDSKVEKPLVVRREQSEVAASAGVSQSTVSECLAGKRIFGRSPAPKLARFFGVGVAAFLDDTDA